MAKRSNVKYPNLKKEYNLKSRQHLIDFDYLHKLSDKEKEYLDKFMGEYMNTSLKKETVDAGDKVYKRLSPKNLHKKKHTKDLYDSNNARNRDVFSTKYNTGGVTSMDDTQLDDLREKQLDYNSGNDFENSIIEQEQFQKDPELYKIALIEYFESLPRKTVKNKEQFKLELEYQVKNGNEWLLDYFKS